MAGQARPRALLTTASLAVALAAADTYVVVLALQAMMESVGLDLQHLEKGTPIISGFLLGYIAVLPLIGRVADLVDRQKVLLGCLAVFVAGSAVTAAAPDMGTLVAGRVIQGVGGGGLVPATLALVASLWPADRRGTPLGVVGAVQELGSVVGPLLGAGLLLVTDWRGIFWVNAGLGLLLALLCRLVGARGRRDVEPTAVPPPQPLAPDAVPDRPFGAQPLVADGVPDRPFGAPAAATPPLVSDAVPVPAADGAPVPAPVEAALPSEVPAGGATAIGQRFRTRREARVTRAARPGGRTPLWLAIPAALLALGGFGLVILTLLQPKALVEDLTYGAPFVQYGNGIHHVLNSAVGVWGLSGLLLAALLTVRSWLPLLLKVDLIGAVALGAALGCVVWTFASADPERRQVMSSDWPLLLGTAAVATVVYALRHRFARVPLIARGLLRARVLAALAVSFCVGAAMVTVVINIPVLARLDMTVSQTAAALHLLRFLVAIPVGAFLGGLALRRLGQGLVAGIGMVCTAVALAVMSTWGRGDLSSTASTFVLALAGFGIGLAIAPVNDAALADAHDDGHGVVSALIVVARMTGMILGLSALTGLGMSALYSATTDWQNAHQGQYPTTDVVAGFIENDMLGTMFLGAAGISLLAAALCVPLGLRRRTTVQDTLPDAGAPEPLHAAEELAHDAAVAPASVMAAGIAADAVDDTITTGIPGRTPVHHDIGW